MPRSSARPQSTTTAPATGRNPTGRRSTTTVSTITHSEAVFTITVDGPAPIRPVASFQITTSRPTSTPAEAAGAKPGPGEGRLPATRAARGTAMRRRSAAPSPRRAVRRRACRAWPRTRRRRCPRRPRATPGSRERLPLGAGDRQPGLLGATSFLGENRAPSEDVLVSRKLTTPSPVTAEVTTSVYVVIHGHGAERRDRRRVRGRRVGPRDGALGPVRADGRVQITALGRSVSCSCRPP